MVITMGIFFLARGALGQSPITTNDLLHPSVFNTQEELERIKYRVTYEPTSAARLGWNQMTNTSHARLSYQHVPYSNVVVVASGGSPSEDQFRNDAHAAYAMALQWVVTGNTQYRDKALTILNAWGAAFVTMSPDGPSGTASDQIQLEAAWAAPIWIAAADIIRYYDRGGAGWNTNDIARFDGVLNYLYAQSAMAVNRANNWAASAALTMVATGAYQNNRARFNAGIQAWRTSMNDINGLVNGYNDDSIYEVCRDVSHPQYTLQVWQQAAEIAWAQGTNLYDMRIDATGPPQLSRNLQYFGQLFRGLRSTPCGSSFDATYSYTGAQSQSGAYDFAYNHYINRLGLTNLPVYADMVVNHWRPGGFDNHFVGWSTLTHGDLSAGLPVVSALMVTNLGAGGGSALTNGTTLNLRSYTNGGWMIAAQTTGTVSWVQFQTNGVAFTPGDSNAPFTSTGLPSPGNYFLGAVPLQSKPSGSIPGDLLRRFVRVIDLSTNWNLNDIGSPAMPSWVREMPAVLTVAAAGNGVAGTNDQFGFVSASISGDLQITAQLSNMEPFTTNSVAGIMVRDGNAAGAKNVFLGFAPLAADGLKFNCRALSGGATASIASTAHAGNLWLRVARFGDAFTAYYSGDGASWTVLGSTNVPMSVQVQAGLAVASGLTNTVAPVEFSKVLLEPLATSYAEWRDWIFTRRGLTDPAMTGGGFDADGDARSNQMEYWLGSDPLVADVVPPVRVRDVVGDMVRCRFMERQNAAQSGRVFLYSTNLVDWSPVTPNSIVVVEDFGAVVTREVTFPVSATAGFYRSGY